MVYHCNPFCMSLGHLIGFVSMNGSERLSNQTLIVMTYGCGVRGGGKPQNLLLIYLLRRFSLESLLDFLDAGLPEDIRCFHYTPCTINGLISIKAINIESPS